MKFRKHDVQLARRDPAGAWARAQDAGSLTFYAKAAVLQTLGESQPDTALLLAQQDASTRQIGWAAGGIMQTWFMRDRQAALAQPIVPLTIGLNAISPSCIAADPSPLRGNFAANCPCSPCSAM